MRRHRGDLLTGDGPSTRTVLRPDHSNPCRHFDKFRERPRDRYLSRAELGRLGRTLDQGERTGTLPANIVLILRVLLFTGCRRGEIQKLRWDEVDFDRGILHLRDSKTGSKIIPLSSPALDLLLNAPRFEGNPYVCAGDRGSYVTTVLDKYWKIVKPRAELEDLRLHDLRHTFASIGVAGQLGLPVIGKLLGHTNDPVVLRANRRRRGAGSLQLLSHRQAADGNKARRLSHHVN